MSTPSITDRLAGLDHLIALALRAGDIPQARRIAAEYAIVRDDALTTRESIASLRVSLGVAQP